MTNTSHEQLKKPVDAPHRVRVSLTETILLVFFITFATAAAYYVSSNPVDPRLLYERNSIDQLVFEAAGKLVGEGRSPYLQENQIQHIAANQLGGERPPFAIPFAYPPNSLPFFQLRALNTALYMAVTVLLSLLLLALLSFKYLGSGSARLALLFTAAFWTPALLDISLVQTGHVVSLFACCFLLLHDEKPILAGIALGLLAFKPHYAIPLGLVSLARQNWPLLISAVSTFLLSCLFSALLYGWWMWVDFWQSATTLNTTLYFMESWVGVAALIFPAYSELISQLAIPIYAVAMLLVALTLITVGKKVDLLWCVSLAVILTLIFSPNTHLYDMSLILIPVLYITRESGMRIWPILLVFLAYAPPNTAFSLPNVITLSVVQLLFMILFLILFFWVSRETIAHSKSDKFW